MEVCLSKCFSSPYADCGRNLSSSIIGFIVMMTVFPVPTLGASIMDKTEESKMKAVGGFVGLPHAQS